MHSNINIMRKYRVQESSLLSIRAPERFLKTYSPEGFMKYIKLPSVLLFFSFGGSVGSDRVAGSVHIPSRPVIGLSVRSCAAVGRIA